MFDRLTEKLSDVFHKITSHGKLTEKDINEALKQVRLALLEADVSYRVVKEFLLAVSEKATGQEVMKSLSPGQQVIKIVYDELTYMIGGSFQGLELTGRPPWPIMLVGLQGSGKTTTAGKLAYYLKKHGHQPFLVPADVARPAAITQLTRLAEEVEVPVYPSALGQKPPDIAAKSLAAAGSVGADVVIIDTAGRLTIDQKLMEELKKIRDVTKCQEVLLVADGMTGQEAVRIATDFDRQLDLSGIILTKMEGDTRGGAAMSIRSVTKKPLKFIGVGEKISALEPFHPDRMASMILGMGDILSLIEKAQEAVSEEESQQLLNSLASGGFTLNEFRKQMNSLKKMGSIGGILKMIPGLGRLKKLKETQFDNKELGRIEAIIDSMNKEERANHTIIDASRRRRIAMGSGTTVADVNQLLKNFTETRKIVGQFAAGPKTLRGLSSILRKIQ